MTLIRSPRTTSASQSRPAAGRWSTAPWRSEITRTRTPSSVVHRRRRRQTHPRVGFDEALLAALGLTVPPDVVRHIVALDHSAYSKTIPVTEESLDVIDRLKRRGLRLG